jgi:hypothetical protein
MRLTGRARLGVLALLAAVAGLASAVFALLSRLGLIPCGHHVHAADALKSEGIAPITALATAAVGTGDVCPILLNAALVAGALALALLAWLALTAAAPLVGALAAALRILVAPGGDVPWLARTSAPVTLAATAVRRRRSPRAPPVG